MAGAPHPQTIYSAVFVDGALSTSQDLTVGGMIVSIATAANVITLGGKTAPVTNNNKDSGFEFQWNNGTAPKLGFIGFQRSSQKYSFIPDATVTAGVYSGAVGTLLANLQGRADTATTADRATLADTATNATSAATAVKLTTARTLSFTGDVVTVSTGFDGTVNVAASLILTPTGITAGTYNTAATSVTPMTFDAKGRLTSLGTPVTIAPSFNSITGLPATLLGYGITDGVRSVALTGPSQGISVTGSTVTSSGGFVLSLTNDLLSVENLTTTGLVRRTAPDTWSAGTPVSLTSEVSGSLPIANLASGTNASLTTFLRGDNSWSNAVTAVMVATANGVSATIATQGTTPALTFTLGAITPSSVVATGAISGSTFSGGGAALTALNASALSSGIVPLTRLGTTIPDATMYLRGDNTWMTALSAVTIVTANGVSGSIATPSATPAITLTLGAITPSSVAATGTVSGTTISGTTISGATGTFTAAVSAASFAGSGANLTALNAANLSTGTVPLARLGASGTPSATTFLNGANAWGNVVLSVTIAAVNGVSATVANQGTTPVLTIALGDITPSSVVSTGAITGTTLSGAGSAITALNASNLSTGTVGIGRLGLTGVAGATTFLRGDNAWSTAVTAVTVSTANGVSAAIATQGTTPALTFTLGAITPSSVVASGNVTATAFIGSGALLTAIDGGSITTGVIAPARLGTGTLSTSTYLRGDGIFSTAVTSVSVVTSNGVSGTVATASTTPAITIALGAITPTSVTTSGALSGATVSGVGTGLTSLDASQLSQGTAATARLGSGTASITTFLRGDSTWANAVTAVSIATANGVSASVATQGTTPVLTVALGAITPTSVAATGAISGTTVSGTTITASTGFTGPGANITGMSASQLTTGTVAAARLGSGTSDATTFLSGDQTYKTVLTGASVVGTSGILTATSITAPASANVPSITFSLGDITPTSVSTSANASVGGTLSVTGAVTLTAATSAAAITSSGIVTAASFSGSGSSLTALNASNLTTGVVATARLASIGTANASTFLSGDQSWKAAVTSVTVTAANGVSATVATQGTTPALTFTLGAITPTSVAASGNGSFGGTLSVTGVVTGASFTGAGSGLTALNASNLSSGTVVPARLGTGTPSATTYLAGDNSWVTQKVLQVVTGSISPSSGNAAIPFDNTVPTSTEGNLVWSQTFTPLSATSIIVITTSSFFSVGSSLTYSVSGAVFNGTTCIGAQRLGLSNNSSGGNNFCVIAKEVAGSTAARTYSFKAGPNSSTSVYYGQGSGGQAYGNVGNTGNFTIMEIAP